MLTRNPKPFRHGNLVGNGDYLKKVIYIIKNDINKKVYVGQTVNLKQRWLQHISNSKRKNRYSLIDLAISKFGIEHFNIEVLEKDVEDYDQREIYWIEYFNSMTPNGYNITQGGSSSGVGCDSILSKIKNEEDLDKIILQIKNTNSSFDSIAKEWNVSPSTISSINLGRYYYNPETEYPIRKNRMSDEELEKIFYSLKNETNKKLTDISKEFSIDLSVLNDINYGKLHKKKGIHYPIRKGKVYNKTFYLVKDIVNDIKNTDVPLNEIAKKYGITKNQITNINLGRAYKDSKEKYPLRLTERFLNSKIDYNVVKSIKEEIFKNEKSLKEIAKIFNVRYTFVLDINNGLY